MQTSIENKAIGNNNYPEITSVGNQIVGEDITIVDYMKETENGESIIKLYSQQLFSNQIKVSVRGPKIILIISEFVDARKPNNTVYNTWEVLNKHSYTRIHNIRIMLPGDNFYILRNYEVADDLFLKIVLGRPLTN
uniref:hypothetical protein n=1 Tax=uncultured Draconibacterium sp. TaxID=1573823 RepID=UPI003216BA7B